MIPLTDEEKQQKKVSNEKYSRAHGFELLYKKDKSGVIEQKGKNVYLEEGLKASFENKKESSDKASEDTSVSSKASPAKTKRSVGSLSSAFK